MLQCEQTVTASPVKCSRRRVFSSETPKDLGSLSIQQDANSMGEVWNEY